MGVKITTKENNEIQLLTWKQIQNAPGLYQVYLKSGKSTTNFVYFQYGTCVLIDDNHLTAFTSENRDNYLYRRSNQILTIEVSN